MNHKNPLASGQTDRATRVQNGSMRPFAPSSFLARPDGGLAIMALLLATMTAGCDAPSSSKASAPAATAASSSTFGPISSGSGTFRGMKGVVKVAGHVLKAKDGQLALDGTPYGTVEGNSESTLTVNDAEVKVQVDGIVRKPGSTTR